MRLLCVSQESVLFCLLLISKGDLPWEAMVSQCAYHTL